MKDHPRTPSTYIALLRGINVGGHKIVKMDRLRKAFEELGFKDVDHICSERKRSLQVAKDSACGLVQKN